MLNVKQIIIHYLIKPLAICCGNLFKKTFGFLIEDNFLVGKFTKFKIMKPIPRIYDKFIFFNDIKNNWEGNWEGDIVFHLIELSLNKNVSVIRRHCT